MPSFWRSVAYHLTDYRCRLAMKTARFWVELLIVTGSVVIIILLLLGYIDA